jgi:hypothetical protein
MCAAAGGVHVALDRATWGNSSALAISLESATWSGRASDPAPRGSRGAPARWRRILVAGEVERVDRLQAAGKCRERAIHHREPGFVDRVERAVVVAARDRARWQRAVEPGALEDVAFEPFMGAGMPGAA